MSVGSDQVLRADLASLRAQIAALQTTVEDLVDRVERLEITEAERGGEIEVASSWQAVSVTPSVNCAVAKPTVEDPVGFVEASDNQGRERLAEQIGRFLGRAAKGEIRGSSGRDRLRLPNRCYLIVADFEGVRLQPPIYTQEFSEVRRRCKRGPALGNSIFVGLASRWEAEVAARHSGLPLPAALNNA